MHHEFSIPLSVPSPSKPWPVYEALVLSTILLMTALTGCTNTAPANEADSTDTRADGDGDGDGEALATSYWQDVAPIYFDSCVSCHREGGIAPFPLDDYESAAAWGLASAMAVENKVMPPWLVTDDGTCNSWHDSPVLSQEQIDTITTWVDEGTPEGTPRDDLSLPDTGGLTNTIAITTPEFYPVPEGGLLAKHDEYRCFLLDPQLDHDMFMTGYEVIPGNDALVHHLLAMPVDPTIVVEGGLTNMQVMQALDDESPERIGWPCLGVAGDGVEIEGLPISWAPGQGVVELPQSSGYRIAANNLIVVQIHYNMFDASLIGQSDSTTVELAFVDEVAREGLFDLSDGLLDTMFEGDPHVIPAGEPAHEFTWRFEADSYIGWQGAEEIELWGFFPHMHAYGTSLTARVFDENDQELGCVGEVPRWDFHWQLYYFMEQPIMLKPGYEIEVTCTYDTTSAPTDMLPGWGTFNEMCLMGMYILAP
jgi:mono/diheme cytochrome c family protein